MAEGKKPAGQRYPDLRGRLWNQPRPRQILERLEQQGATPAMLEAVAGKFIAGQQGEAEILAAVYNNLLHHQDRTAVLRRIANLRVLSSKIQQDLLNLANELGQIKSWEAYRVLGYQDWMEFAKKELGLPERIIESLLIAREQADQEGFGEFLQRIIKGYVVSSGSGRRGKSDGCKAA